MLELGRALQIEHEPSLMTEYEHFRLATHRHLTGEEVGGLLDHCYAPHGGKDGRKIMAGDRSWVRLTRHPAYYLSVQDKLGLVEDLPGMAKVVPHGISMLDVAPGDWKALLTKSSIVVDALESSDYTGLELCPGFAVAAREVFGERLGDENVRVLEIDAFHKAQQPICKRAAIYCGGSTAVGLRGAVPSGPPIRQLSEMITVLTSHAEEAFVVMSYANNAANPAQLLRAYNNEPSHDFQRNVLFRMADELDMRNFDPRLFEGMSFFYPKSGCVAHRLIPTTTQTFTLDGEKHRLGPECPIGATGDERIHIGNSFQIARSWLDTAAENSHAKVLWHSQSRRPIKHVVLYKSVANNNALDHLKAA